jgi:hypothetical protein
LGRTAEDEHWLAPPSVAFTSDQRVYRSTKRDQSQLLKHWLNISQGLCIGATPSWHSFFSSYCIWHFERHASFDGALGVGGSEGADLVSCADAEIIKDNISAIAKNNILIMTDHSYPLDRILTPWPAYRLAHQRSKGRRNLAIELAQLQAGEAIGLPFSTT